MLCICAWSVSGFKQPRAPSNAAGSRRIESRQCARDDVTPEIPVTSYCVTSLERFDGESHRPGAALIVADIGRTGYT